MIIDSVTALHPAIGADGATENNGIAATSLPEVQDPVVEGTSTAPAKGAKKGRPKTARPAASTADDPGVGSRPAAHPTPRAEASKSDLVLKKLRLARGVTVAQVQEMTGWQPHSVRGFFSGVVRKKMRLNLVSEVGKDGQRRYRVTEPASDSGAPS